MTAMMEDTKSIIDGYGGGGGSGGGLVAAAPFVLKTYGMVNEPSTDAAIAWGKENNSFVVVDPFLFSQTLLPSHFKHSNFSSFVRQLNTYGFRKVDPDRWEFAHASFLRGQTHLLRQIVRRKQKKVEGGERGEDSGGEDAAVAMEVVRLKREQRAIEERVARMWRRVRETERRPRQMLDFLFEVGPGDPQHLHRLPGPTPAPAPAPAQEADAAECRGEKRARRAHPESDRETGGAGFRSWPLDCEGGITADVRGCGGGGYGRAEEELISAVDQQVGFLYGGDGGDYGGVVDAGGSTGGGFYPYAYPVENGYQL